MINITSSNLLQFQISLNECEGAFRNISLGKMSMITVSKHIHFLTDLHDVKFFHDHTLPDLFLLCSHLIVLRAQWKMLVYSQIWFVASFLFGDSLIQSALWMPRFRCAFGKGKQFALIMGLPKETDELSANISSAILIVLWLISAQTQKHPASDSPILLQQSCL